MAVGKVKFDVRDVAMLIVLYESPGANYTTYGLSQALHPAVDAASQRDFGKVYDEVRTTSERLIMLDLVDGNRLKGNDGGIFYSDLKLTKKGQREAIEVRSSFTLVDGVATRKPIS
jgi:hypothetical protein